MTRPETVRSVFLRMPGSASLSVPCPVGGDRLLEVRVLLTRDQANFLQCCEMLCGLRGVVQHQVRFADVFMGSAMPGVEAQGDFIVPQRFVEPAEVRYA